MNSVALIVALLMTLAVAQETTTTAGQTTTVAATTTAAGTTTTTTVAGTTQAPTGRFECFKCSGPSESCQEQRQYETCPPTDAPVDMTGYYRCMLATNKIDNTVFQGCVSTCKADSNDFYERQCTTLSRGNCIEGLQCTQAGPDAPIAAARVVQIELFVMSIIVALFYLA